MMALFDTHVFMWWASEPWKLSARAVALCLDPNTTLVLSVVSVWEILIKVRIGKLPPIADLAKELARHQQAYGLQILPVTLAHVLAIDPLPPFHKDPFDRLLIAQTQVEGAVLLSADPVFSQYPVQVAW